jgi:hypothetical protein
VAEDGARRRSVCVLEIDVSNLGCVGVRDRVREILGTLIDDPEWGSG